MYIQMEKARQSVESNQNLRCLYVKYSDPEEDSERELESLVQLMAGLGHLCDLKLKNMFCMV